MVPQHTSPIAQKKTTWKERKKHGQLWPPLPPNANYPTLQNSPIYQSSTLHCHNFGTNSNFEFKMSL